MALVVRIDVDRPYGKRPLPRHMLSRLSSDYYFPKVEAFGYLRELKEVLCMLNDANAHAYLFFRQCTLPSDSVIKLIDKGKHEIGLHLEDSRLYETFAEERHNLEMHIGKEVHALSKHGSGGRKYGRHHYAPYEPEKYVEWARQAGMKLFFGNLEDPTLRPQSFPPNFTSYPGAFWLEPAWRDIQRYPVEWLLKEAKARDVVLLLHPENILADDELAQQFRNLVTELETKTVS